MEPRSSRLLSGRRVPSRHSARFINRSALAIAIDALSLVLYDRRPYRPVVWGPKRARGPDSGEGPRQVAGALTRLTGTERTGPEQTGSHCSRDRN
ncbi:hypothetical protein GCM10010298_60430 [Streptomyces microflavus]|uniref:Uncharacterized protein n=1 Tax=Streptomyces microflavus TaxID=1919 RepID=A0A7J0CJQ6_STRMI|nr:hypothetical protein Smic_12760 [Streptomyces microflavus]GGX87002.1 hypothetical protein GCM10010298_60430 [Streptomyces microflavus]